MCRWMMLICSLSIIYCILGTQLYIIGISRKSFCRMMMRIVSRGKGCLLLNRRMCLETDLKYGFSSRKQYTPKMALNEPKFNLVYASKEFEEGKLKYSPSYFVCWVPAIAVATFSYFTSWMLATKILCGSLFFGGFVYKNHLQNKLSYQVYSVQVEPDLSALYLAVPASMKMNYYKGMYFPSEEHKDLNQPLEYYNPKAEKGINFGKQSQQLNNRLKQKKGKLTKEEMDNFVRQGQKYNEFKKIELRIHRLKIRDDQIDTIRFMLKQEEVKIFEQDKEQMAVEELFKKYENTDIEISTIIKDHYGKKKDQYVKFVVKMGQNGHVDRHDVLMAMAMGYEIEGSVAKIEGDAAKGEEVVDIEGDKEKQTKP